MERQLPTCVLPPMHIHTLHAVFFAYAAAAICAFLPCFSQLVAIGAFQHLVAERFIACTGVSCAHWEKEMCLLVLVCCIQRP